MDMGMSTTAREADMEKYGEVGSCGRLKSSSCGRVKKSTCR